MLDFCRRDDAGLFDIPFLMKFFWWDALPGLKESDTVLNNFWHCEEHPHDVILRRACNACVETIQFQCSCRTSQWMHDATFSHRFLFLPRRWALGHLPVGIPSGQKTNRFVVEGFCTCHFAAEFMEPGVASLNDVSEDYKDHVRKHMPILRQKEFGLARAANYLESWIDGTLVRMPLLDLNQPFDFKFTRDCFKLLFQFDARSTAGLQILAKLRCEDATSTQF